MKVIAWDTETHLLVRGNKTPRLVVLTLAGGQDTRVAGKALASQLGDEAVLRHGSLGGPEAKGWVMAVPAHHAAEALLWSLETADVVVGQNQSFDWGVLVHRHPELLPVMFRAFEEGRVSDTRVREMLLAVAEDRMSYDERMNVKEPGFGLAFLVLRRFGVDIGAAKTGPDIWRLRYSELDGVPLKDWPQEALDYALSDAEWTRAVYLDQGTGALVDELPQIRADLSLHLMSCHGVRTDPDAVSSFAKLVHAEAAKADAQAREYGWMRVNRCKMCAGTGRVGAPPALRPCPQCRGLDDEACRARGVYKTRAKGFEPTKDMGRLKAWVQHAYHNDAPVTKTGQVSTETEVLETSGEPVLEEYAKYLSYIKLRDTYLPILEFGLAGALTSSPHVLRETGRTSWKDPNFQNPPRAPGYRECYVPRPGKVFASVDYSVEELCCLAQVCLWFFGHSRMAEVINAGQDIHLWFAANIIGISYEEALARLKGKDEAAEAHVKFMRQLAKVGDFGIPGGMGARALAEYATGYGVTMSLDEAADLIKKFKAAFPEMAEYFKMVGKAVENGNIDVTQFVSKRIRGGCGYTVTCNTYFQGLAADIAKCAMWRLTKACYLNTESPLYGCRVWNFVHDEFLLEGPEGTAHLWAPEVSRIMVQAAKEYTPDVAHAAPPAIMRRWYKGAEPVYDDQGRLVPWEPANKE